MAAFDLIVRRRNANDNGVEETLVPVAAGESVSFDAYGRPTTIAAPILKSASVTLTHAQILALSTTAIEIVPVVEDKILLPVLCTLQAFVEESGAYTGIDTPSDVGLVYEGETTLISEVDVDAAGLLDTEGTNVISLAGVANFVPVADAGLFLHTANAADYDDGNAANTLKVDVWYVEVDA